MKVFGRKYFILKHSKNGKLGVKCEEFILLGYSTRSKAYKYLNTNTNNIVESENVSFDEYTKVHEDEPMKKLEEYKSFVYFYEGMAVEEDASNQVTNQQKVLINADLHPTKAELHLGTKLHSDAKL